MISLQLKLHFLWQAFIARFRWHQGKEIGRRRLSCSSAPVIECFSAKAHAGIFAAWIFFFLSRNVPRNFKKSSSLLKLLWDKTYFVYKTFNLHEISTKKFNKILQFCFFSWSRSRHQSLHEETSHEEFLCRESLNLSAIVWFIMSHLKKPCINLHMQYERHTIVLLLYFPETLHHQSWETDRKGHELKAL